MKANEPPTKAKLRRRKRRIWVWCIVIPVALLALDQAWVGWDRRIVPGHDTTRITAPMSNGYVDYLGAINDDARKGITPENNGAPLLLEALGGSSASEAWRRCVYHEWGMTPVKGGAAFESYPDWMAGEGAKGGAGKRDFFQLRDEIVDAAMHRWSREDHAELARWIELCEPAMAELEQACARPRFYMPTATPKGVSHDAANLAFADLEKSWNESANDLARGVLARAMLRLQRGDWDGFEHDVELIERMARRLAEQPTAMEKMTASRIDEGATLAIEEALQTGLETPARADALREELQRLGPMPSLVEAFDKAERFAVLDTVCSANREGYSPGFTRTVFESMWFQFYAVNYSQTMRDDNAFLDDMVKALGLPDYQQRQSAIKKLEANAAARADGGIGHKLTHPGEVFLALMLPSASVPDKAKTRWDAERALAMNGLALRAAKEQSGEFPASLADLKGFGGMQDPFTGKALMYRRKGEGFVLYSVGPDLKDDGGTERDLVLEVAK
jgi:hypothetical protein